jgi:hypothetical protein
VKEVLLKVAATELSLQAELRLVYGAAIRAQRGGAGHAERYGGRAAGRPPALLAGSRQHSNSMRMGCDALLMAWPCFTGSTVPTPRRNISDHVRNALAQLARPPKSWLKMLRLCMSILANNCNLMSPYFRHDGDKSMTSHAPHLRRTAGMQTASGQEYCPHARGMTGAVLRALPRQKYAPSIPGFHWFFESNSHRYLRYFFVRYHT